LELGKENNKQHTKSRKRADVAAIAEGVIGAALSFVLSLPRLAKKGQMKLVLTSRRGNDDSLS